MRREVCEGEWDDMRGYINEISPTHSVSEG